MKHLHFIVNPAAGGGSCTRRFGSIQAHLDQLNIDYSVVYSEYPGHASLLARQAITAQRQCVVAVGGDGTVREIAEVLLYSGIPMGILPMGTGNDFIRALGVPADPSAAIELLLAGTPRHIDAASANGTVYLNVAGFGFDVEVLTRARLYKAKFRGLCPYLMGLLHALFHLRSWSIQVTVDGETFQQDALVVSVGNGTHIGGGINITPLADVADGLLDICIVRKVGRLQALHALSRFIHGKHLNMDITRYFKANHLVVECTTPAQLQLDGEIMLQTPVTFSALPGALLMITG